MLEGDFTLAKKCISFYAVLVMFLLPVVVVTAAALSACAFGAGGCEGIVVQREALLRRRRPAAAAFLCVGRGVARCCCVAGIGCCPMRSEVPCSGVGLTDGEWA